MTLQESIYKTLYYFNLAYDAPLSLEQLHSFLWKRFGIGTNLRALSYFSGKKISIFLSGGMTARNRGRGEPNLLFSHSLEESSN